MLMRPLLSDICVFPRICISSLHVICNQILHLFFFETLGKRFGCVMSSSQTSSVVVGCVHLEQPGTDSRMQGLNAEEVMLNTFLFTHELVWKWQLTLILHDVTGEGGHQIFQWFGESSGVFNTLQKEKKRCENDDAWIGDICYLLN